MSTSTIFKATKPDHWTIEQALCYLALGQPDDAIIPPHEDANQWAPELVAKWLNERTSREQAVEAWCFHLEEALNARTIQAWGRLLSEGWTAFSRESGGGSLEGPGEIPRTTQDDDTDAHLRCSISIAYRYPGRGIALALMDSERDRYNNELSRVYVCVELPAKSVRALKRRVAAQTPATTSELGPRRGPGRTGWTETIQTVFRAMHAAAQVEKNHRTAAPIVYAEIVRKHGDVVNVETVERRLREFLK